jgi:hypothetical protein
MQATSVTHRLIIKDTYSSMVTLQSIRVPLSNILLALTQCNARACLFVHYVSTEHKDFGPVFNSRLWEWYILIKHASEAVLLAVILFVLNGKFGTRTAPTANSAASSAASLQQHGEYEPLQPQQQQPQQQKQHHTSRSRSNSSSRKGYQSTAAS